MLITKQTAGSSKKYLKETIDFFKGNRVQMWKKGEIDLAYIQEHKDSLWSIRETTHGGGVFLKGLASEEVVDRIQDMNGRDFILSESLVAVDKEHLICNGEVMLTKDEFGDYIYYGFINTDKSLTLREASKVTESNKLSGHRIPEVIKDFIWSRELVDYVVEFSCYDTPVGINNLRYIIWEIRKY